MRWLGSIFRGADEEPQAALALVQDKFAHFLSILESNNNVLKVISDMEEKAQGDYLLDMNYIHTSLGQIREGVDKIVEGLIGLGGEKYTSLRGRCAEINAGIARLLPGTRPVEEDAFTIPFDELGADRAFSVGSKSAQLGEMKRLGLPVPDGFAISAWAYKHFMDANDLQARISDRLAGLDIKRYEDLVRVGEEIQALVTSSPVPDDLSEELRSRYAQLEQRAAAKRFALRSSAIGEDTQFSFAGQYATFLNVGGEELVDRYRQVLASKFSAKAIYYFLSHELTESELAMGVGCMFMVDAVASGVTYTQDPVRPDDDCVVINSVFGLGKYLVDGTLTPDVFRVARNDGSVIESELADKPVRLVLSEGGGTTEEPVPQADRKSPSISAEHVAALADYALKLEAHYGDPQDIEWAVDRDGTLYLLQARPLRVLTPKAGTETPDVSGLEMILSGGTTVCPGAGGGQVFWARSTRDLANVPDGAVLVAPNPFPGLITVMDKVNALVVETGGVASHMATIAREYRLPTLAGLQRVGNLTAGRPITVDATDAKIYVGVHEDLIAARRPEYELFEDTDIFKVLEQVLARVSPLNLLAPSDPDFVPEKCRTLHDITRFAHQRAMEEMFSVGGGMAHKEKIGLSLKSDIPLPVRIIYIDQDPSELGRKRSVRVDEIASAPMSALWEGIQQEGWPSPMRSANLRGFASVLATTMTRPESAEFADTSFAILGKEYMIVSLHLGYHFTTVEAMCSPEVSKNYIRLQYKEGGASLDRRTRRVKLMTDILSEMGFEHASKGDFLDATLSYQGPDAIAEKLRLLGRITMMTKQLDMALSSDAITQWYTEDFMKKLGLLNGGETES